MFNGLVKVKVDNGTGKVSARELYLALGLDKSHWTRWYKKNIINNEFFKENIDWVGFAIMANGNEVKDFHISIEMGKHLAMMARTSKSHEIRQYFIDCEQYILDTKQFSEFMKWREQEGKDTHEFYSSIESDKRCIGLSLALSKMVSYKYNLPFRYNKEQIFQTFLNTDNKEPWNSYVEMRRKAEVYVETYRDEDEEHFMSKVISALEKKYIDNIDSYKEYCKTHNKGILELEQKLPPGKKYFGELPKITIE